MGHKHEDDSCGCECGCGGTCKGAMSKERKLEHLTKKEQHLEGMLAHVRDVKKSLSDEDVEDVMEG